MIKTYNKEQLDYVREGGKILAQALSILKDSVKPGISTMELDKIAEDFIRAQGAEPAFMGYNGYKHTICASVNEEAIHGIPRTDKILKEGDIISVDCGVKWKGFCTDAARTIAVGKISDEAHKLIDATEQSFFQAIKGLKAMSKVGDIGTRIENYIKGNTNFSIIEKFCGHGIGEEVHQEPRIINYVPKVKINLHTDLRKRLPAGCVIAIEPMINVGTKDVKVGDDGWTVVTGDGKLSAHYENTVIVLEGCVEVVTL
ncbi:MAG: type I methionyl aminopeptidase [Firmicutes bacterium]|nr:type I methionyl aminopeptidase [Bacillota bacterium]